MGRFRPLVNVSVLAFFRLARFQEFVRCEAPCFCVLVGVQQRFPPTASCFGGLDFVVMELPTCFVSALGVGYFVEGGCCWACQWGVAVLPEILALS